jgi:Lrp/AsnC family leucine-responsive transcriptional regulator
MHGEKLDEIDLKLLEILQKKGRTKRGVLAEEVGLSIPTISERLQKMEQHGIIRGYKAVLNNLKIGLEITAYIFLTSESSAHYQEVTRLAVKRNEIQECHAITGAGSHLLKVRVPTMARLEKLLGEIQRWPGIKNTTTDIVLSTAKESTELMLDHLKPDSTSD